MNQNVLYTLEFKLLYEVSFFLPVHQEENTIYSFGSL
jgi:hypothetical protein